MTSVYKEYEVKTKMVQEQCLQLNMKFFLWGGGGGYTGGGGNFCRWGKGMSKFLASGATYIRHSRHVRSYQNMSESYLYEKILP